MEYDSCILEPFEHLARLTAEERSLLAALEENPRTYPPDTLLNGSGRHQKSFFTLTRGWACALRILPDGQRQILDIYLPGQIMGLREMGHTQPPGEFLALTEVTACPFPGDRLQEVFQASPRLGQLFFRILAGEQSMLIERIVNIGRRPAAGRLAHFLIEMHVRLKFRKPDFELPLSQSVIGDALGLSSVHISRSLGQLREEGLVRMEGRRVQILDLDGLAGLAGFSRDDLTAGAL